MTAGRAHDRHAALATLLALAGALFACAALPTSVLPPSREDLLRRFESGDVRLDCARCRYDFRGAQWLLEQGHYETLVAEILTSGDGSGRSWYLLGRVAEATDRRELALHYYEQALATPRNPILALWPLYEDLNYRTRRLATRPATQDRPERAAAPQAERENVNVDSLVVQTRPGAVGAFVEKLRRGDTVEVIDRSGDWEEVRLADGRIGWAWGAYTNAPGAEPAPERATAKAARPRRAAKTAAVRKPAPAARRDRVKAAAPAPQAEPTSAEIAQVTPSAPGTQPAPRVEPPKVETAAKAEPGPATAKQPAREPAAASPRPARTTTSRALANLIAALPAQDAALPVSSLLASGDAGILGCPLPRGAELSGRSHGSAGSEDHPTETYAIDAPAQEIMGFYEREMERAGWRKSFAASEYLLYFEKDDRTVGVLIERKGGLFTLMGS